MNPLSPLGWILIFLLIAVFIGINVSLFTAQKKKNDPDSWVSRLQKAATTLRNPFHDEEQKMESLAQQVLKLKRGQTNDFSNGDKNE